MLSLVAHAESEKVAEGKTLWQLLVHQFATLTRRLIQWVDACQE